MHAAVNNTSDLINVAHTNKNECTLVKITLLIHLEDLQYLGHNVLKFVKAIIRKIIAKSGNFDFSIIKLFNIRSSKQNIEINSSKRDISNYSLEILLAISSMNKSLLSLVLIS